jgi:hypothetical protein
MKHLETVGPLMELGRRKMFPVGLYDRGHGLCCRKTLFYTTGESPRESFFPPRLL